NRVPVAQLNADKDQGNDNSNRADNLGDESKVFNAGPALDEPGLPVIRFRFV
ncbi:MAG: hypothetical protein ACI93G_000065, partial [Hyphomonas sp.]